MWKASNSRKLAFPDTFLETVVSQWMNFLWPWRTRSSGAPTGER
jgi:hypothetical protein